MLPFESTSMLETADRPRAAVRLYLTFALRRHVREFRSRPLALRVFSSAAPRFSLSSGLPSAPDECVRSYLVRLFV